MERTTARNVRSAGLTTATLALLAGGLSACGSDEAAGASGNTASEVASGDITITAIDYAYLDVPSQVRVGSTLELVNDSQKEAHELVAIRLPDDEGRPTSELLQLPPDELAAFFPGVRTVVLAAPDADGFAVVGDGTLDEPGRYAIVCMIPTDADPDAYIEAAATSVGPPDVAGGPPHIAQGMFAELTVVE